MGAITRAAANNITTSGLILPAGINDASVASISVLAQVSAGDGITLISTQTASASASISFTSGIDSTYRTYIFEYINCHPTNDQVNFEINFSTDGGSNYNVTKTTSIFYQYHGESAGDAELSYSAGIDIAQGTGFQQLCNAVGNDNDQSCSGYLYLFSPSSTTYQKHFLGTSCMCSFNDYTVSYKYAGYGNTTSAINAVKFQFGSGDIDDGQIKMYGIV